MSERTQRGPRPTRIPGDTGDIVHIKMPRDLIDRIERRRGDLWKETGEFLPQSVIVRQLLHAALLALYPEPADPKAKRAT